MSAFQPFARRSLPLLAAALAVSQFAAHPVFAQSAAGGNEQGAGERDELTGGGVLRENPYGIVASLRATPSSTSVITTAIRDSYNFCARLRRPQYLVDCQGEQLGVIAASLSKSGDYGEARKVLLDASAKLRRVAVLNQEPSAPRIRAKGTIKQRPVATKPLTPVRRDKVKAVNREAAKIMAEAETKLLRSSATSDRRQVAYAEMAKAVGSNKTLLRSA